MQGPIFAEWFKGGRTNIAYNCLDRHVSAGHGGQPCFLFEGNDPGNDGMMTYAEVLKVGWAAVPHRSVLYCTALYVLWCNRRGDRR